MVYLPATVTLQHSAMIITGTVSCSLPVIQAVRTTRATQRSVKMCLHDPVTVRG